MSLSEEPCVKIARRFSLSSLTIRLFCFLFLFFFLLIRYSDYLYVVRNYSFFSALSTDYFRVLREPGGVLELCSILFAGTFENACFGSFCLALLFFLLTEHTSYLWRAASGKGYGRFALALAPGFLATAFFLQVGLDAFESPYGYLALEPFFGVLLVVATTSYLRWLRSFHARVGAAFLLTFLYYPASGAYSLIFAFFFALDELAAIAQCQTRRKLCPTSSELRALCALVLFAAFVPVLWGAWLYPAYGPARLYRAGVSTESIVPLYSDAQFAQKSPVGSDDRNVDLWRDLDDRFTRVRQPGASQVEEGRRR